MKQTNVTGPMDRAEAQAITDRIRNAVDNLGALVEQAHDRRAWKAMGYPTWEAYVSAEFGFTRQRSYQLLDQGRVAKALGEATGDLSTDVVISEAAAREIKPQIDTVKADVSARVEAGEEPAQAVKGAVDAARKAKMKAKAEKAAKQADNDALRDRHAAALPDAIKQREQAKTQAIAARKSEPTADGLTSEEHIAELEEAVRVLEAENAELKAENKLYGEMKVQFEQGGFDKVVAGKDEEIRVLQSRLYQESADKASWMKSAKYWQAEAKKLGFSRNVEIDIETGEIVND